MVAEVGIDGQSRADVARRHGLHSSVFGRWCGRYGARAASPSPAAPSFIPVAVVAPEAGALGPAPESEGGRGEGVIEVVLANGRRLVTGESIAPSRLRLLIAAVEAA